jgi:hypothetical protein
VVSQQHGKPGRDDARHDGDPAPPVDTAAGLAQPGSGRPSPPARSAWRLRTRRLVTRISVRLPVVADSVICFRAGLRADGLAAPCNAPLGGYRSRWLEIRLGPGRQIIIRLWPERIQLLPVRSVWSL